MNHKINELIDLATEDEKFNEEKFVQLVVERCSEILNKKALSFYDPNNKDHIKKQSWDRSVSWAIRDASEEIKQEFGVD